MNNLFKNIAIWMVIGIVLMTVFNQFSTRQTAQNTIDYSQFMEEVRQERISKVTIQGRTLEALTTDGKKVISYAPPDLWMVSDLLKYNVKVVAKPEEEQSFLTSIFVSWFPMLLSDRRVDLLHAPDAGRRQGRCLLVRQEQGAHDGSGHQYHYLR